MNPQGCTHRIIRDEHGEPVWEVFCKAHAFAVSEPLKPKPKAKQVHYLPIPSLEGDGYGSDDSWSEKRSKKKSDSSGRSRGGRRSDSTPRFSMAHANRYPPGKGPVSKSLNFKAARPDDGGEDEDDEEGDGEAKVSRGAQSVKSTGTKAAPKTFPIRSMSEWPGQAEGEAMDLDHFWNVVGSAYPEDHSTEVRK